MSFTDVLLAVLIAAIWGLNFVVIKVGLGELPPFLFGALRFLIAALPLAFLLRGGRVIPWRFAAAYGLALGVAKFGALFVGMRWGMGAGLSSLVLQSQAFFTALLSAAVLRDRPRAEQMVGMGVAAVGLAVIAASRGGQASLAGFALVLLAAFFWGVANIVLKKAAPPSAFSFLVAGSAVAVGPLFVLSLVLEAPASVTALTSLSTRSVLALLYIGVLSTLVAFSLWGRLMKRYSPNVVAPFSLLVPVFGMSFSTWLLEERYAPGEWLGAALLLAALALPHWVRRA